MVAIEDNDAYNNGVEGNRNSAEKASLGEVAHDIYGDLQVETEAQQTHGCKEDEERDIHDLYGYQPRKVENWTFYNSPKSSRPSYVSIVLDMGSW